MSKETTPAGAVFQLLRGTGKASLATSTSEDKRPFASLVAVATAHDRSPVILLSQLAEHTQHILNHSDVSLLFESPKTAANPQQIPRVSILGTASQTDDPKHRARYLARHPEAAMYESFGDFHYYRIHINSARYVGGFAKAASLENELTVSKDLAEDMAAAEPRIIKHMNEDHLDAIQLYAHYFLGLTGDQWKMAGCDIDGIDLSDGTWTHRLSFKAPLTSPDEARAVLVDLVKTARA